MATAPKTIAADLADSVFGAGPKIAAMSQAELDSTGRQEWPLHFAAADALGGVVKPFDKFQGPYIKVGSEGRMFIYSNDGIIATVWNEDTKKESKPFNLDANAEHEVVAAVESVCESKVSTEEEEKEASMGTLLPGIMSSRDHIYLNSPLDGKSARMLRKTADGSMLGKDDQPSADVKLQQIVGDPMDQPISAFAQFWPNVGSMQMPNPLSPIEGDACFFTY